MTWKAGLGAASIAAAAVACSGPGKITPQAAVVYPPAPEAPRVQFLTWIADERDVGGGGRSFLKRITGEKEEVRTIGKPYGVAAYGGRVFVCDLDFMGLDIIDLEKRSIEFFVPEEPWGIRQALNCFVDDEGLLYVADGVRKRVQVFDSAGTRVAVLANEDDGEPADVFVYRDRVFVSHLAGERRIRAYDRRTGALLYGFPDVPGTDSTGIAAPANIFVFGNEVYVSDMLKQRVFVYSMDGKFRRHIGRPGQGPSTFQRPKGIAVDSAGFVYVADGAFQNVQVFSPEGRLLMFFGGGDGTRPGDMSLPAKVTIDYAHRAYFQDYVLPGLDLKHLIFVTNQFGPGKVAVYGFVGDTDYVIPPADTAAANEP